jgi:uncharacterized protein YggE
MKRLIVSVALACCAVGAQAQTPSNVPFGPVLSTSGQGEAKVTPDRVSVMVNVQTRGATAAAAGAENAKRTQAVFDAMIRLGLPKDQLTTEGYNVYPEMQYSRDGGTPKVTGYVATNTVRVESKRVDQAGAIIDAALGAGANLINGVSFYANSIESPRREAIAAAVASARADAEAMARAAGGGLGDLIELTTGGPTIPPRPMYDMAAKARVMEASAAAPTPMNPGLQTVTVFVTGRWKFVPNR